MLESHQPLSLTKFKGLFDRGSDNAVPVDHFRDCLNLEFSEDGCETRHGADLDVVISSARRIYTYKRPGEAPRKLILTNTGDIFDSLNLVTPILSIPAMTDFSMTTFFGRAYISPHNGVEGLPNEFIYVYDGTTVRQAGGNAPTGSLTVTTSALSGFVESGTHLFAVSFETASGFITKPGPAIYAVYSAPGGFKVDISNIPTGPTGTVARRIVATKVVDPYSGDQENQEYFFVPEGRIPNNIDTTITVDFFDNDLQSTADYLFFQRETIPACVHLSSYKNRLVAVNYDGGNSIALVSNAADPESFSELDGFIAVDPSSSESLRCSVEFRSLLYLIKATTITAYSEIPDRPPAEWSPENVDFGMGTEVYGVQRILDKEGANTDKFILVGRSGLQLFTGVAIEPDLTYKVYKYWDRVNFAAWNKIQIYNDPLRHLIYVALPLDSAILPNFILVGEYSSGLDPVNIKWTPWNFPWVNLCIAVDVIDGTSSLKIGSENGNIYSWPSTSFGDNGTSINSYFDTAHIRLDDTGGVLHLAAIRIHGRGLGNLQIDLFNQDSTRTAALIDTPLVSNPGVDYTRRANFKAERFYARFRTQFFDERFIINALTFFVKPLWAMRPQ